MPIFLVAMDQRPKSEDSSIIALNVFDNDFKTPLPAKRLTAKRLSRDASVFAQLENQAGSQQPSFKIEEESFLTKSQRLFKDHLRCGYDDKVLFVLKEYPVLRENNSLAKKMWDAYCNVSEGFTISSPEDYEEGVVSRECIVKVSLLLACNGKNRTFLRNYEQKYGTLELLKIIGYANFETMCGTLALKAILGPKAYEEYRDAELKAKVLAHVGKFDNFCGDDEILD